MQDQESDSTEVTSEIEHENRPLVNRTLSGPVQTPLVQDLGTQMVPLLECLAEGSLQIFRLMILFFLLTFINLTFGKAGI